MITIDVTWNVYGQDKINSTKILVGPGQDILADAPRILAVLVWGTNTLAHQIKINSLVLADVTP